MTETSAVISKELLAILVCPIDKQALELKGNELVCVACGHRYQIEVGIPNMLVEEE